MFSETAPAKINLYLHVTGRREDGYHLLDSLAVFASPESRACDRLTLLPAEDYALEITGPEAGALAGENAENNLVTRVLRHAAKRAERKPNFKIALEKHVPVASGIGGGSADAAAALRAAARYWNLPADHPALAEAARATGADVSCCLASAPCFFEGIGDETTPAPSLPPFALLLVNPRIPLLAAGVFRARAGPFGPADRLKETPRDAAHLAALLKARRNDLQDAAIGLCAVIGDMLAMLESAEDCLLARMSGSGATCFGLFAHREQAERAAENIRRQLRECWIAVSAG